MSKENDDMDFLYYAAPATIVVGLIVYFFEVWLPNLLDSKKDVDLEEAKKIATTEKGKATKAVTEVAENAEATAEAVKAIEIASATDKMETKKAVEEAKEDVKSFLEKEGMHVTEIFPED